MNRVSMLLLLGLVLAMAFLVSAFWPVGGQSGRLAQPQAAAPAGSPTAAGDTATQGRALANRYGCVACHSLDGSRLVGASWKGLYGSQRELDSGQKVTADDAYLAESIKDPDAKIVKGFARGIMGPVVQPYAAELARPENLDALIGYIKTLK